MTQDMTAGEKAATAVEIARYRTLSPLLRACLFAGAVGSVLLSAYVIFGLGNVFKTYVPLETEYFYVMLALLLPLSFVLYPVTRSARAYLPWYDAVLALAACCVQTAFPWKSLGTSDGPRTATP